MARSLESYLPDHSPKTVRIQAWVTPEILARVNKIRKPRKLFWDELITGLLMKLLDDLEPKPPKPESTFALKPMELSPPPEGMRSQWK